ncbi:hypothetical protein IIE26_27695 (plasmid) [Cytobacillus oceanisediminis]|uniref:hypothetical protein n=1 Tax=Cytobacillus oceanisediminis TaxID=665099 RepID=UPI001863ACDD|nr:hypothetical protein [Cytobacillus oceanisediminis]QOK29909.1 hypothetical protein IIE26_27695 [Cytobacillus oceanisediminis]
MVSSFDYYERALSYEIKNLGNNPPNKYSSDIKEDVLAKMKKYNSLHVYDSTYWKHAEQNIREKHLIENQIKNQFPKNFGENASPAMGVGSGL